MLPHRSRRNLVASSASRAHDRPVTAEIVYKVVIRQTEEGVSAQCPALPGCWSQGEDESEALENIADAIREYLASLDDELEAGGDVREVRVAI
jgi:predicted RNase H-like HicB family nuclease